LSIPNTFSPNLDGVNDFYFVKNLNNRQSGAIKIYNRWGNLVFENASFHNCSEDNVLSCWFGNNTNGQPVAEGVYFYELVVDNKDVYTGSISLFR
jgi:gliding motility-associated-like protein